MGSCANGVRCGVVEWVTKNILRQLGHIERKKNEKFVKKVDVSKTVAPRRRERRVVRWKNTVNEFMHERVADRGIEIARRKCLDREKWRFFCCGVRFRN